ncbi:MULTISPECIES: DUF4189 domain-containing protein [unclassified Lysobacter]|uniref:DUF4189 domain-containing protein n=1 Tax=unclassified Lysobacter TaxID=2635362 RepID=UPI001BE53C8C|nr:MULTISPECIES: DUF4189 domain-containing protein [unclassified Lysobacter]MBT2746925.1 DUF4189 domain-containing protein [Lysobacter sp. ISL-42]MBT2750614.1 DUF4189 domain-containing protein [Lysobacter sp. ISL-50]MBT2776460.1 DUF4189 domain-containing protein [Lysobacter sp. ISL-54]MBT2780955.1 DUF4189 domain-containing protein [Lysobacter sp. ISL-52]
MHFLRDMLLLAALPVGSVFACPPGTVPQQGVGWQGCAPVPGTGPSTSSHSAPKEIWEDRWGAVAVDDTANGVGIGSASGMKRKGQAEKAALTACKKKGGARCEVKLAYYSQCAALVWGDHGFTINGAPTIEKAAQIGVEKCNQAKDTHCEVYFSDCSFPERIQ